MLRFLHLVIETALLVSDVIAQIQREVPACKDGGSLSGTKISYFHQGCLDFLR